MPWWRTRAYIEEWARIQDGRPAQADPAMVRARGRTGSPPLAQLGASGFKTRTARTG